MNSDKNSLPVILPCPFCGNKDPQAFHWANSNETRGNEAWCQGWLICGVCHTQGPPARIFAKQKSYLADHPAVIKQWNQRITETWKWNHMKY